jgi:hypothetical protein
MEYDKIELGKRALACRCWRWMSGMSTGNGGRVFAVDEDGSCRLDFGAEEVPFWCTPETMSKMTPDLTDPATLGCLLALVREAWGDSEMHMTLGAKGWVWLTGESRVYDVVMPINAGETEAEALVAALESAP